MICTVNLLQRAPSFQRLSYLFVSTEIAVILPHASWGLHLLSHLVTTQKYLSLGWLKCSHVLITEKREQVVSFSQNLIANYVLSSQLLHSDWVLIGLIFVQLCIGEFQLMLKSMSKRQEELVMMEMILKLFHLKGRWKVCKPEKKMFADVSFF